MANHIYWSLAECFRLLAVFITDISSFWEWNYSIIVFLVCVATLMLSLMFFCIVLFKGLNRLASYESNKDRLHSAGLLSVCILLLEPSCSDEEILVAMQTFWIMSFNSQVRSAVVASGQYMNGWCMLLYYRNLMSMNLQ